MASAAQERRNERARELGFENDYDRRIRGGDPSAPRPTGEDLDMARGHRGAADFDRLIHSGSVVSVSVEPGDRNSLGQWVTALFYVEMANGDTRIYRIRQFTRSFLDQLYYDMRDQDIDVSDRYNVLNQ